MTKIQAARHFPTRSIMKLSRGYIIAFTLALLPILAWLGSDSARQVVAETCPRCESSSHHQEDAWCFWGMRESHQSKPVIQPSLVLQDFPEFHCDHHWVCLSAKITWRRDGPLFEAWPREHEIDFTPSSCGGSLSSDAVESYNAHPGFRDLLGEALESELVTREQVVRWFEFRGLPFDGFFELRAGEAEAFASLDAMLRKFLARPPAFLPLPIKGLPKTRQRI